jgi:hypothetical protein
MFRTPSTFGRASLVAAFTLFVASCIQPVTEKPIETLVSKQQTYSYVNDVKPILEHKCIACHACYDAPCQLKLTSAEGLLRGATKNPVYDGARITAADPTRLFVDAHGRAEWRAKGFFSVFNDQGSSPEDNLANSTFYQMIDLGRENPLAANTPVPADIKLGLARKNECPVPDKFDSYAKKQPQQGMPLAITGLSDNEYQTLRQWIYEGGVIDEKPDLPTPDEQVQIQQWESFFNQSALRNRLVSRYLYEHLYPAHLYFDELDTGNFYELVRSSTPSGQPISIIATLRPNDNPGGPLYYRLRKVQGTLVYKTHMPYPLGERKMRRFEELFLSGDWEVAQLPDYSRANTVNALATFKDIPARGRYQFLLDTAQYFVMTFIRGSVCAGQIATNVIEDQFFVLFQDPESDLSVTDPAYMADILPHMVLVPQQEGLLLSYPDWKDRLHQMNKYNELRGKYYRKLEPQGRSLDDIWDGDGSNGNAALTVFRNFDNAMVSKGFVGADSKTVWVMDYPMLERTYYLLVVNFDVFGSLATQAETRLYFDLMRANGENNFLHFMPPQVRTSMRDSWYVGSKAQTKITKTYTIVNEGMPVEISYGSGDPKAEFISKVAGRLKSLSGFPDPLNRCAKAPCYSAGASEARRRIEASLQTLTSKPATSEGMGFVDFMPDVAFLRVSGGDSDKELAYTLIRNKAHTNVAFMLDEEKRRKPGKDTLTIYPGLLGSYPNFMFNVPLHQIEAFTGELHAVNNGATYGQLVGSYGLMRTHPDIWTNFQWFVDYMQLNHPLNAGVYDLSRYKKVADIMADENE